MPQFKHEFLAQFQVRTSADLINYVLYFLFTHLTYFFIVEKHIFCT